MKKLPSIQKSSADKDLRTGYGETAAQELNILYSKTSKNSISEDCYWNS